jgi:general secretion pathway protein A
MYHHYWRLTQCPFRNAGNQGRMHASPGLEEALARLHFLVDQRRRLGLVLARAGCGKSLVLDLAARQLRGEGHDVARTSLLGLTPGEFLWRLAAAWGLNPRDSAPVFALWRQVVDHLAMNRCQGIGTVLLLDDADEAAGELLAHVVRLAQADPSPEARLTIVLAADPQQIDLVGPRIVDLAELRIDIPAWDEADTADYVRAELARAGGGDLFAEDALQRLHELARGVPRRVRQLADLALLAGAGKELSRIDAETVSAVNDELAVGTDSLSHA